FADRGGLVKYQNYLNSITSIYSLIQSGDLSPTMITPNPLPQISMPIQALYNQVTGSKVFLSATNTRTFISTQQGAAFTVPILFIATTSAVQNVSGSGFQDSVYVNPGAQVDASGLGSAGQDYLYLTGNFSDYTQTVSAGGIYTFTGKAGTKNAGEVLIISMNGDSSANPTALVFADRGGFVGGSTRIGFDNTTPTY
ncbi:MAG: hypothetical protein ORN26_00285, partial [Candidatus Pacebacteria bacterium]|nr:hypothetical protein [Candidatus Paceibacterota bacterium]